MTALPPGTVTFLFTDIEGSTRLWEHHPDAMQRALARHDALMREVIAGHDGAVFKTVGDAFCAAFATAQQGLAAALDAQRRLRDEPWVTPTPIRVRMALHTGAAEVRDDDYFGPPLNRVARLLSAGHGGQVLLSQATQALVRDALPEAAVLRDMGERRLKDLIRPERVYQLGVPDLPEAFPPLKTLDARAHNLPVQATSFVGREREIRELRGLLATTRLITLTGAGGAGKSRLALQVAAEWIDECAEGVWLVELAALADPGLVAPAVARVLGVADEPGRSTLQSLAQALAGRETLVLLDNCEHLIEACATLAAALVAAGPGVRVLATSREPLRIAGESAFRVPPLPVPDASTPRRLAAIGRYDAVRLFIDRALAADPAFRVDNASAPALASICHRLDGIPLAIELAAARVRALGLDEIERRLDRRFALLTAGARTALPRQQTLRALIDWSHDLLHDDERMLLARAAVFAGGFTLRAAEAVCGGEGLDPERVVDLVASLVDKSLLAVAERDGAVRYGMLETVRAYAQERLDARGEAGRLARVHLAHFAAHVEAAAPLLTGPDARSRLDELEAEHDNLRAALACAERSDADDDAFAGLRLAADGFLFWSVRGHLREGREWLRRLLARVPARASPVHGKALRAAASLAWRQGDLPAARTLYERELAVFRELGDRGAVAGALGDLGGVACDAGDYAAAERHLQEALALQREVGYKPGIAFALNELATIARAHGDHDEAQARGEAAVALWREAGDERLAAMGIGNLGLLALARGDLGRARECFDATRATFRAIGEHQGAAISTQNLGMVAAAERDWALARTLLGEALAGFRDIGDRIGIADALEALAGVVAADTGPVQGARLWGCAERLRESLGRPLAPAERSKHDADVAESRARSGNAGEFDAGWAAGREAELDAVVAAWVR